MILVGTARDTKDNPDTRALCHGARTAPRADTPDAGGRPLQRSSRRSQQHVTLRRKADSACNIETP